MRYPLFVFAALFSIAVLAPRTSHAAGNVLLPSDNSNSASLPNLGLSVPAPSDATAASQPAIAQTPAPQPLPPVPAGSSGPAQMAVTPPAPSFNLSNIVSTPGAGAHLPPGAVPTTVIHQPDMSSVLAQIGASLPYSLTIAMSGQSLFGAKDVQEIGDKLGLNRDQVASSCILTAHGLIETDKGNYLIAGGASPQVTVRYDGAIKSYLMTAQALCAAGVLPPGSGYLTETGGRYSLPLQPIACTAPNRQVTSLTVTYDGSGTSRCVYE